MEPTHLHLVITHLPIFGSILGAIVLIYGLTTRAQQTLIAAYIVLIISSVGALIAHKTGEAAEETMVHMQGISENLIHEHEESAEIALLAMIVVGLFSMGALFLAYRKSSFSSSMGWLVLLLALISFGIVTQTGYLGGQIRHSEINPGASVKGQEGEQDSD